MRIIKRGAIVGQLDAIRVYSVFQVTLLFKELQIFADIKD